MPLFGVAYRVAQCDRGLDVEDWWAIVHHSIGNEAYTWQQEVLHALLECRVGHNVRPLLLHILQQLCVATGRIWFVITVSVWVIEAASKAAVQALQGHWI